MGHVACWRNIDACVNKRGARVAAFAECVVLIVDLRV